MQSIVRSSNCSASFMTASIRQIHASRAAGPGALFSFFETQASRYSPCSISLTGVRCARSFYRYCMSSREGMSTQNEGDAATWRKSGNEAWRGSCRRELGIFDQSAESGKPVLSVRLAAADGRQSQETRYRRVWRNVKGDGNPPSRRNPGKIRNHFLILRFKVSTKRRHPSAASLSYRSGLPLTGAVCAGIRPCSGPRPGCP